ncbi:MAG: hypothetical protein EHM91_00925 [Planctomycetota bacterium]|nr:MAG: hypothetical protein EHM91_00925 [Planctomycetota bacterium]
MMLALAVLLSLQDPAVDLSRYDPACGVKIERRDRALRVEWPAGAGSTRAATFSLDGARPLLSSLEADGQELARDVKPSYVVTTGARVHRPNERYIFFDKPAAGKNGPVATHDAVLALASARVESAGARASIAFSTLSAGPFSGELIFRFYAGSPFFRVEAALGLEQTLVAYIYDFTLDGDWKSVAWKDNVGEQWTRVVPEGAPKPVGVRNRAIFAETPAGCVGVFPPPHAFFFPRDHSVNFKFAQVGKNRFGLRQDPAGGPGHQGTYIPWFDAPAGKTQRMAAFVWLDGAKPEQALERLKAYTHGDAFKPVDGRFTFTSHWHVRLAMNELAGKGAAAEASHVFKGMGVNIVHLAEFHGDGNPNDPGPKRLPQMKKMFEVCRQYSDERLLYLPGEEANVHLNTPAPKGTHAGHWLYLFPKPVYLTLVRGEGVPFKEEIEGYGTVYHAGSEADMVEILRLEKGLGWTAHPRIKASSACPDSYKEKDWFKDDLWLGGAWKAMPADLSENRLGVRVLDLLDDMNTWGRRKQILGEVDTFELDRTHELYGHMNVNYLKLEKRPTVDDWSPVLGALRAGDFFTTTGEVLIHSFEVKDGKVRADLEWTFPLSQVEIVTGDGKDAKRRTVPMAATGEFGRQTFEWPLDRADATTVRLEAWDVATNGAFTQPLKVR